MLTASQIYAKIDKACGTNSTNYPLTDKAVDVNIAQADVYAIALKNIGWDVDDFNHTHDPFITTNLVSGQRNYYFTTDEEGSLILGISKVQVKDSNGVFHDLTPVNMQGDCPTTMTDGQSSTGTPTTYDKTGNGIFLDLIPNYNSTGGLRVFIDREPISFASTDTTKISGIDGLCHDYLYLKPSYEYARDKGLQNTQFLFRDLQVAIDKVNQRYAKKEKDIKRRLTPAYQNNK